MEQNPNYTAQPPQYQQQPEYAPQQPQYAPPQQPQYAPQPQYQQQQDQQMQPPQYAAGPVPEYPVHHGQMKQVGGQVMAGGGVLQNPSGGVVVRQVTQGAEALQMLGLPLEFGNVYQVGPLPPHVNVGRSPDDPDRWQPTHQEMSMLPYDTTAKEDSDACLRCCLACCGGLNLRPFKMHFRRQGQTAGPGDMVLDRPCMCGGCWGPCCRLQMTAYDGGGRLVGQVRESFDPYCTRCCQACCLCTVYHDVRVPVVPGLGADAGAPAAQTMAPEADGMATKYRLRVNQCCCGRTNNCCGATCCKSDQVFDVLDAHGNVVSHVQKMYAPGSASCTNSALCRCCLMMNNYAMSMPRDATPTDRALLTASLVQVDYHLFEKKGGNDS